MRQKPNLKYAKEATVLLQKGFVIIDFEGTASSEDPQVEIVQIGIIDHTGKTLIDTLVKPERPINAAAEHVHGIHNGDVNGAQPFNTMYPELSKCLSGNRVATWNDDADRRLLEATCKRHSLPMIEPGEWIDVSSLYSCFWQANRSYTLTAACRAMGVPVKRTHRAVDDCLLTLQVMQKIAEKANPSSE